MSTLIGSPDERLPLSRVVDALIAAGRQGGRPSSLWVAGFLYPSLIVSYGTFVPILASVQELTGLAVLPEDSELDLHVFGVVQIDTWALNAISSPQMALSLPFFVLLWLFLLRLISGLAWTSDPETWEAARGTRKAPRLRHAWRAGRGITISALGLFLLMAFLRAAALFVVLAPLVGAAKMVGEEGVIWITVLAVIAPVTVLLVAYSMVLEVLTQLGLHSLARNRRGTGSAINHAWRLVRNDPWSTIRATVVDLMLQLVVGAIVFLLNLFGCCLAGLGFVIAIALNACIGVVRAGFWARMYRGLGGLSPADGVPGLEDAEEAPA